MSRVGELGPGVSPRGNAGEAGTVVAAAGLVPRGAQQWMCAAEVLASSPLNVTLRNSELAAASRVARTWPVPGETIGGTSFAPLRVVLSGTGIAWADNAASIGAAIRASNRVSALILPLLR